MMHDWIQYLHFSVVFAVLIVDWSKNGSTR